jgi:lipopolysaccharide transport system ATP-binding protein
MSYNDLAIKINNLSKRYRIGLKEELHSDFGAVLIDFLKSPLKNYRKYRSLYKFDDLDQSSRSTTDSRPSDIIWAVRNVSFEMKKGEVVGIIGKNGAGKSTLLKILSKITDPTSGYAEIRGRIASLLEVGTGFHPELTGRENVYLNGTVLGMTKKEVDRKFDEIVDFSGVEKFIDTPVKRYSSGMSVRLAFSVAAHLEPEILLVDEVLAVGDVGFQAKCLGKMKDVAQAGRTILFVSHNMGAITNLCTSAIWIDDGKIAALGDVRSTIDSYLKSMEISAKKNPNEWTRIGGERARIIDIRILDTNGRRCETFGMGETIVVEFDVDFYDDFVSVDLAIEVGRQGMGINVLHLLNQDCGVFFNDISPGMRSFRVQIPNCMLYPGLYSISICVGTDNTRTVLDYVADLQNFTMIQSAVTKRTTSLSIHKSAIFFIPTKWEQI